MNSNMQSVSGGMSNNSHLVCGGMSSNLRPVSGGMGSNLQSISGGMSNNMQLVSGGMGNNLQSVSGGMSNNLQPALGGMNNNSQPVSGGMTLNMHAVSGGMVHNMQPVSGAMTHTVPSALGTMSSHHMQSVLGTLTHNTQPTSGTMTHNVHLNSGTMQPNSNTMTHNIQPGSNTMNHNVQQGLSAINPNLGSITGSNTINNNLQSVSGIMNHTMQLISSNSQITGMSSMDDYSESASQWQQLGSDNSDTGQRSGVPKRPGAFQQAISFGALMPMLIPNLPHDKQSNLISLYQKLKTSEISKEDFLRNTRMVVGDQVLVGAVRQLQMQKQSQGQVARQQVVQGDQQQHSLIPKHMMQQRSPPTPASKPSTESQQQQCQCAMQAQDIEQASSLKSHQQLQIETISAQYQNNPRVLAMRNHPPDLWNQAEPSSTLGSATVQQVKYEINKIMDGETVRGNVNAVSLSFQSNNSSHNLPTGANPNSISSFPGVPSNTEVITSQTIADGSSALQTKSKKQKVGGDVLEESIHQLNDVTAVSGVNLREEEEQLLAGPKEESRTTNAIRRFAQEEEGRLFLERILLHAKVTSIAAKYGVTVVSEDVDQCLSMSLEERLRNMLYKLMKISSWRHDSEKDTNKIVVTCDIQRRITLIRKRAKEAHERKQALETERLRKLNEEKEKASENEDPTCTSKKDKKAQKAEDGKSKPSVANVTSRSSAGVNDMLLKWQMMAEQGRQKREGTTNDINPLDSTDNDKKPLSGRNKVTGTMVGDGEHKNTNIGGVKRSHDTTTNGGLDRQGNRSNQSGKNPHTITTKDVIRLLEMEPQMAKSPILYRLYAKNASCNRR